METTQETIPPEPSNQPDIPNPASELDQDTGQTNSFDEIDAAERIGSIDVDEPDATGASSADHMGGTDGGEERGPGDIGEVIPPTRKVSPQEFFEVFCIALGFFGWVAAKATRNPGFEMLSVQPDEMEKARRAADGVYRLGEIYPRALGWMIHDNAGVAGAAMKIVPFADMKSKKVQAAIRQRPAQQPQQPQQQRAPDPHMGMRD